MSKERLEYKGKTRAEWRALSSQAGGIGVPSSAQVQEALLWFQERESEDQVEREERHFQMQLDHSAREGKATRRIAWWALVVSIAALAVSIIVAFLKAN